MSRTELWEAPKGSRLDGHVAFSVGEDDHVRLPYTMLASILQTAGLRRKITTHHEPRLSLHPADTTPVGERAAPPGYRWIRPRECHGSDTYCDVCSPNSPERKVVPDPSQPPS